MKKKERKILASTYKEKAINRSIALKELVKLYKGIDNQNDINIKQKIKDQRQILVQAAKDYGDFIEQYYMFVDDLKKERGYLETKFLFFSEYHDMGNDVFVLNIKFDGFYARNQVLDDQFRLTVKHDLRCIESVIGQLEGKTEKKNFNIESLIEESFRFLDLKGTIKKDMSYEPIVNGDENSVYRVIFNILNNAKNRKGSNIKASIDYTGRYVKLTFSNEDTVIKDTKNIFKYTMKEEKNLGIKISKKIVDDNSGKIKAYNINKYTNKKNKEPTPENNLAVFEVYLPIAK